MITLTDALHDWGSPSFNARFKEEVEHIPAESLPLQQGLSQSSQVSTDPFTVMVLSAAEQSSFIRVKTGVFYSGITPGCSCEDDPTPLCTAAEHCELQFDIDKQSGEATVTLLPS